MYGGMFYWPPDVNEADLVEAWTKICTKVGYERTDSREHEPGFEKIAIYVDPEEMLPNHVARSDGHVWKSKLGKGQDIDHLSLEVLEGNEKDEYGRVQRILKRPINL